MYVCIYIYICMYVCTYIYVYMCIHSIHIYSLHRPYNINISSGKGGFQQMKRTVLPGQPCSSKRPVNSIVARFTRKPGAG